jgi:fructose-1,6-bisphosphatase/sedoheptulose 1,7-bisphosphatase-like protein
MVNGVRRSGGGAFTESIVMRSKSGTVRKISSEHDFTRKTGFRFSEE